MRGVLLAYKSSSLKGDNTGVKHRLGFMADSTQGQTPQISRTSVIYNHYCI
jgi:hypothetical protein